MRPWSDFYSKVLPWTPGAFEGSVDDALRQACIDFCEETMCLQRTLDPLRTRTGATSYDLELAPGESVAFLLSVSIDGTPADLIFPQQADEERESPAAYTLDRATLVLAPAPTVGGGRMTVKAALKPTQTADGVDDSVHEQYAQAIAAGAIALLCSQPGKPYSNPQMAATSGQVFANAKEETKQRVTAGHGRVRLRVKPY